MTNLFLISHDLFIYDNYSYIVIRIKDMPLFGQYNGGVHHFTNTIAIQQSTQM